jgi:hypothetical protein
MEFHDVALSGNPEGERAHRQTAPDPHASFALIRPFVGLVVKNLSLGSEFIFRPHLFQVDQAALTRAIQPMLERGKREELVVRENCFSALHGD